MSVAQFPHHCFGGAVVTPVFATLKVIRSSLTTSGSIHAVIAIYMKREDRKHREIIDAIERHGPPPGWPPR
jgi:hypothetical protein